MNHLNMSSNLFNGFFGVEEVETSEGWTISPFSFNSDCMPNNEWLKQNIFIKMCTNRFFNT